MKNIMIYQGDALEYIYDTPAILQEILVNEKKILEESNALVKGREISEMYLAGSGSSYNAATAAAVFAKKLLGIRVIPVYPVTLIEDCEIISPKAIVLGISQQGTSKAVIHALDVVRGKGIAALTVTGEYDTEITRHGDATLYVECGYEDAGATTKGYTATMLTLMLFVIMMAESMGTITLQQAEAYRSRIQAVIRNMKSILKSCPQWCEQASEKLGESSDMIVISSNNLKSLLLEGVLKFSETCRFPVRGYEAEEFMHGMYNAVTSQTNLLYLFPADGYELQRMVKLFGYYEQQGFCQYAVNMPEIERKKGLDTGAGKNNLPCRFINDPDFSILEYTLPQQMLFVLTSRKRGIDLNVPKDPEFHKYMGSKMEQND